LFVLISISYYPYRNELSKDDFVEAVHSLEIDSLGGRPLKVSFLYNRDNGHNAAQKAIAKLRSTLKNNYY